MKLIWTVEGKSVISSWGTYSLRVKRLGKGKYWWVISGLLAPDSKRQVKVVDGIAQCQKEGRNEAVAALCKASVEFRKMLVESRTALLPWYRRANDFRPRVGRHLIAV